MVPDTPTFIVNNQLLNMDGDENNNVMMSLSPDAAKCTVSAIKTENGIVFNILLYDIISEPKHYLTLFRICSKAREIDTIRFFCDSVGGSIMTAVSIANALQNTKAKVEKIAFGDVMSAATLIVDCKENTQIAKYSHFMYHMSSTGGLGNTTALIETNQEILKYVIDYLKNAVAEEIITTDEFDLIVNKRQDVYITGPEMAKRLKKDIL